MSDDSPTQPQPAGPPSYDFGVPGSVLGPDSAATPGLTPVPLPPVNPGTARRGRSGMWINVALGAAVLVAVAGVAFAVGRVSAPATAAGAGLGGNGGNGGNGQGRGGFNGYFPGGFQGGGQGGGQGRNFLGGGGVTVEGTVEAVSPTTLTLKTAAGQTVQIALDGSTTYHEQAAATSSDVATGGKVLVRLNVGRFGPGGPSASGSPTGPTASDVTVVP